MAVQGALGLQTCLDSGSTDSRESAILANMDVRRVIFLTLVFRHAYVCSLDPELHGTNALSICFRPVYMTRPGLVSAKAGTWAAREMH